MKFVLQLWQLMLINLAGWVNRQQQEVIEYLRTENAVLKEKLGKQRILLTDEKKGGEERGTGTFKPLSYAI